MKKSERLLRLFCNYIIANKIVITNEIIAGDSDDNEDDEEYNFYIKLSEILKGTNINYESLTEDDIIDFNDELYRLDIFNSDGMLVYSIFNNNIKNLENDIEIQLLLYVH